MIGQSPFLRFLEEDLLSVGEVESPGQDSESLSSPSSNPPLVDVTLSDWCIICKHLESLAYPQPKKYAPRPLYDYYCIAPTPCPDHWSNLNKYQRTEPVNAQPQRGSAPQLGPHKSPDQWRCPFLSPPNTRGGQRPICQSCLSWETRQEGVNIGLKL